MRLYQEMNKILFDCTRKLSNLVYDKKGNYKKGINKKQRRRYLRTQYQIKRIWFTRAEGRYFENKS